MGIGSPSCIASTVAVMLMLGSPLGLGAEPPLSSCGRAASPKPPTEKAEVPRLAADDESVVQAILELHRRGVGALPKTFLREKGLPVEADFEAVLRQVVAEESARRKAVPPGQVPWYRPAGAAPPLPAPSPSAIPVIEETIRQLLQTIEQLERQGRYDTSDQLQETVRSLRLAARALRGTAFRSAAQAGSRIELNPPIASCASFHAEKKRPVVPRRDGARPESDVVREIEPQRQIPAPKVLQSHAKR